MVFFMAKYRKKLEADIRCPLEYGLWWQMEIAYYMRAFPPAKNCVTARYGKKCITSQTQFLAATLKDLIADGIVDRKSYDEIPPRVEYSLTGKGNSVVPILQSICRWSDIFYKEDVENEMKQCQKCDYHR